MNLISCDKCGVVLDARKLEFPTEIYDYGGSVDLSKAARDGDDFVAKVACPVCGDDILKPNT